MQSYLQGEELWGRVDGTKVASAPVTAANGVVTNEAEIKEWAIANAKTEFVLKRFISHNLFEHIMGCKLAAEIWKTLDELLNKENTAQLQFLENEAASAIQGELHISQYFLKINNLCFEISLLEPEEAISEARMKRYIIRGL